jgi:predicted RecA/RadA family phage recombinase
MTVIYKQRGDSIDYTPTADVAAGDVVVLNDLVGIAKLDIKAGELGALAVAGVFDFPTDIGSTLDVGITAYWNVAGKFATDIDTGNKLLGKAIRIDVANNRALVRLSQ